ncbi:hypothetical protein BJN45_04715 [Azonexus hydrophilus]|uniref:Uncharacterized protein n=1 Tax=Azonexus hydrophilus TaxID=418702 RepID=A0A1R1I787_9RHOO|nr:hypothetical protein BJN45_04715 [Azonexus hydrophilus]
MTRRYRSRLSARSDFTRSNIPAHGRLRLDSRDDNGFCERYLIRRGQQCVLPVHLVATSQMYSDLNHWLTQYLRGTNPQDRRLAAPD